VLALLSVGCGDVVIDRAKVEDFIHDDLEKSLHEKINSVDCPSDQKVEAGNTFSCTIELASGQLLRETLKIVNEDADVKPIGDVVPVGSK
jgi:hypothetical protein